MGKSHLMSVFKLKGVWWKHRTYKRYGVTKHCYSARCAYEPIFSKTPLTRREIAKILEERENG